TGRSLRLLPQCRVAGAYAWRRTTTSTDVREFRDADELAAKLPLGAASLQGELARSGRLSMQTTASGQYQLEGLAPGDVPDSPECAGATHLVGALSVGAFKLRSGSRVRAGGGAAVGGVGANGHTESEEAVLRESGDAEKCRLATELAPDPECASPLQAFLLPLPRFAKLRGAPGTVRASFVSADADRVWEVMSDEGAPCMTPCTRWLDPNAPVTMRASTSVSGVYETVSLPRLGARSEDSVRVQVHSMSNSKLMSGATLGLLGGLGIFTGGFLAMARCDGEHAGTCVGGLITLGVSVPLVAGGIWLALDSGARAEVAGGPSRPFAAQYGAVGAARYGAAEATPGPAPWATAAGRAPRGLSVGGSF
ncbi:MAG TPA: hypothetical protein VFS00_17335, partial [Polyangiaceae bacterium]|nr:hypothetical protein [Polyangiaceae bacterium]